MDNSLWNVIGDCLTLGQLFNLELSEFLGPNFNLGDFSAQRLGRIKESTNVILFLSNNERTPFGKWRELALRQDLVG